MASRLRGMTCLSATVIPRVQRLLETGVLKERPVWLDVVEAYPPVPPPTLPPSQVTGRATLIKYPYEQTKREESCVTTPTLKRPISAGATLSLFESRSVKSVEQWPRDNVYLQDQQILPVKKEVQAEPVSMEELPVRASDPTDEFPVRASDPTEGRTRKPGEELKAGETMEELPVRATKPVQQMKQEGKLDTQTAEPTHADLDDKLKELQAILRKYE